MNRYTIYCTEAQTKKALELGAPILADTQEIKFAGLNGLPFDIDRVVIPTAEQMILWLEEQGILIDIDTEWNKSVLVYVWDCENKSLINNVFHGSRKNATLVAIDAALDYLSNNKK